MSGRPYGRVQVAEAPSALLSLHIRGDAPLREVDHEPKVGVLDQSNLIPQGILVDEFIPGARRVGQLGSCTANAATAALSNLLTAKQFLEATGASSYQDTVAAEKFAITFYHDETQQTGDPAQEWPPTDCGSSGPYIVSELQRKGLAAGATIAHGPENLISLLQADGVMMGSPWLAAWEETDASGFIDGDGSASTIQRQLQQGVAGGHETYLCAVEKLVLFATGQVDPFKTVVRGRNSWNLSFGDHGCYRAHLSTLVAIGGSCDFRQLTAEAK